MKISYPQLNKLGIIIHEKPVGHIRPEELRKVLSKSDQEKFDEFFGVQTMLLRDDGGVGVYPWDAEAVLERMNSGRKTGTQMYWD